MNITSYNVTDVSYHYLGLRVLAGMPDATERNQQLEAISRSVLKFVTDRALRLMLPEPRGTFETVGEKICQELVHFQFASSNSGRPYELTIFGKMTLDLLSRKEYVELRQLMAGVHLKTYDNLRAIVQTHIDAGPIWRPIVTSGHLAEPGYIQGLLEPTFGQDSMAIAKSISSELPQSPKRIEDALRAKILQRVMPGQKMGVALFRGICDRLVSLRLLNKSRAVIQQYEFEKSYSPCVHDAPSLPWYEPLQITLTDGTPYQIYLCEPDMANPDHQDALLSAVDQALAELPMEGGYYDVPDLRDWVCEHLLIPEAAFDDGINQLLDRQPSPLSVGLQYDRITGQRRPLVRTRQATQLHNLIRRL